MTAIPNTVHLRDKVGRLFFIGIPGPEVDGPTAELLEYVNPGGVCLFARNIREASQTRKLVDDLRGSGKLRLVSIDQEGGLVDRLRRIMDPLPAAVKVKTKKQATELGEIVGESLQLLGFNMDFAPVVDVIDAGRSRENNGLFSRQFGSSEVEVSELAGGFLKGLEMYGIAGCLKHFPGIGAANVDSHEELPSVDIGDEELHARDLKPYASLNRARAVMVGHAAYPKAAFQEMDSGGRYLPSSLSTNVINGLLRGELGFGGVVISDDLEMGAIVNNYGIGEASKMAILAGCDMVAVCADRDAVIRAFDAVAAAAEKGDIPIGRLDDSIARIDRLIESIPPPVPFDPARLEAVSRRTASLIQDIGS